jgi:pimeloyl-ACP methyl ester carboxylesterase
MIVESQRPITGIAGLIPSGPAAWKSLPSWAVIGTEDRVVPPDVQRVMAKRAGATIREAVGSHLSIISNPQPTIDAVLAAAAFVET